MRWKGRDWKQWLDDRSRWHKWFAWHPVKTQSNDWVWLEVVDRKESVHVQWEYRSREYEYLN